MILQCIDFRHSPQELAGLGDREARDTIVFVDLCPGNIGYMCTCILAYTVAHIQAQVQDGDRSTDVLNTVNSLGKGSWNRR